MKKLLLIFFLSLSILACDKDDEPTAQGTPMENLTGTGSKKWKLSTANALQNGIDVSLIQMQPCWGDNELTLNADGTYTLEDTGVQCNPKEETINSTWSLQENPQQIKLGKVSIAGVVLDNLVLNIKEIKSNRFSGFTGKVTLGERSADKVEMTFVEVK